MKLKNMDFIVTQDRFQITMGSLEGKISAENPVRFVDAFVVKTRPKSLLPNIRKQEKKGKKEI